MNYMRIDKFDMNNGDGCRVVLWLSGCSHHCDGCHNPETWDCNNGIRFTNRHKYQILELLKDDCINGLTLTGGDPMFNYNYKEVIELSKFIKTNTVNKNIWMWTGYTLDELRESNRAYILNYIDVLIDGKYEKELKDFNLKYMGSSNQKLYRRILNKWELK